MFSPELAEKIRRAGVVAVLTIEDPAHAAPVANALFAGGVTAIELTLRTPRALDSIQRIRAEVPAMLVGAGTVLSAPQVEEAVAAGATFGVSPGCNPETLRAARDRGLPLAPGIMTPSDIEIAVAHGCRLLKFFPAESSGGLAHLKNIAAPFAHLGLRYLPLGGIGLQNLPEYMSSPLVAAVGGSWLAKPEVIAEQGWNQVRENAAQAMYVVCRERNIA